MRELQILIQYQLILKSFLRVIRMYFKAVFHFRSWALFFLGYASYQIYEPFHVWKLPCTILCGEVCNTNGNVIPSEVSKLLCLKYDLPNICWVWNAMKSNSISILILEYEWYAEYTRVKNYYQFMTSSWPWTVHIFCRVKCKNALNSLSLIWSLLCVSNFNNARVSIQYRATKIGEDIIFILSRPL